MLLTDQSSFLNLLFPDFVQAFPFVSQPANQPTNQPTNQRGTWDTLMVATKNHETACPQGTFVRMEPLTDVGFLVELSYEII